MFCKVSSFSPAVHQFVYLLQPIPLSSVFKKTHYNNYQICRSPYTVSELCSILNREGEIQFITFLTGNEENLNCTKV